MKALNKETKTTDENNPVLFLKNSTNEKEKEISILVSFECGIVV